MRLILTFCALALCAPAALAQDWFTREVCDVSEARIVESAFAPATLAELEITAQAIPNGIGKYWQITAPNGAVSHLLGTVHSNTPRLLDLPDQVMADIASARVLALETDFVSKTRKEYYDLMNSDRIWHSAGRPTFTGLNLPPEIVRWIRARFDAIGWGHDGPDLLELPTVVEFLLSDPCSDFADGTYPIQDSRIQMLGAIEGAEILGLEHPMAMVNRLNEGQSLSLIRALIATYGANLNPNYDAADTATFQKLYLDGRLGLWMAWEQSYFQHLFEDGRGSDWLKATDEYLLVERNHDFLAAAQGALNTGGVFMAVGCFNLPGQDGMVSMLRRAGYKVKRVALPGEVPS